MSRSLPFDFGEAFPEPAREKRKPEGEGPRTWTVGELGRAMRRSIDGAFEGFVWLEGEVQGARLAPSGHMYCALKDEREDAAIDVVIYRTSLTARGRSLVADGARIRLRGRPTLWAPKSRLQFTADRVEPAGKGALLIALEQLKEKLAAEGLFSPEKKRALPKEPRRVGVVTSAAGAVIHDICVVAFRRGAARILLSPALVQGQGAAESVCRAIARLERVNDVDVILVARGGGGADDLAVFNDERVVRAVAACRVPVVSAVGHEVDVTLTDFAADVRAATPSEAAELLVPDQRALASAVSDRAARLERAMRARLHAFDAGISRAARALGDPRLAIAARQQRIDDLAARLESTAHRAIRARRVTSHDLASRLSALHPRERLTGRRAELNVSRERARFAIQNRVREERRTLENLAARLHAMSPLAVLGRGYAIAIRVDGRAVRSSSDVEKGDVVQVRVHDGSFSAQILERESGRGDR